MNISIEKLVTKMEAELQQARASKTEGSLRERIYSIKILCELILDEKQANSEVPRQIAPSYQPAAVQQISQPSQTILQASGFQPTPTVMPQAKKLEMDDEANGDSLFDF